MEDHVPYSVQLEPLPTNTKHCLLKFRLEYCANLCQAKVTSALLVVSGCSLYNQSSSQWLYLCLDLSQWQW